MKFEKPFEMPSYNYIIKFQLIFENVTFEIRKNPFEIRKFSFAIRTFPFEVRIFLFGKLNTYLYFNRKFMNLNWKFSDFQMERF